MRKSFNRKELALVKTFVKAINPELKVKISENKRFECDIPKKTIYLGLKTIDEEDFDLYQEWYQEQAEYVPINKILIALLHEIGHFQTFNQEEWESRNKLESIYIFMYEERVINYDQLCRAYWDIPNERKATMWGVEFYKSNKSICDNLAAALGLSNIDLEL